MVITASVTPIHLWRTALVGLCVGLLLGVGGCATRQMAAREEGSPSVAVAFEQQLKRAAESGDTAALNRLVADDFVGVASNGKSFGKEATVRFWAAAHPGTSSVFSDIEPKLYGDTAVVRFTDSTVDRSGRVLSSSRTTDIWVRTGGVWQLVGGHVSKLTPAGAEK